MYKMAAETDSPTLDNKHEKGRESDSDFEVDEYQHARLLGAIGALDGKKSGSAVAQRSEPGTSVSEFGVGTTKEKVSLHELIGTLHKDPRQGQLKKHLKRVQKDQKVLATPLSRPEQERVTRTVAYKDTVKEVSKWDPVIKKNRKAEQLKFPLDRPDMRMLTTCHEMSKRFEPHSSLEKEVAALLSDSSNTLRPKAVLTPAEERALRAMSLEEAKIRRAELQKHRALLSYQGAKARRQKKIKSKRYHRIMKKDRQKKDKKELEELEKTDPEAYNEKMQAVEKRRLVERMSLRHRGGSKFGQKQTRFAKYDQDARQTMQDMNQKSRELTAKVPVSSESEGESLDEEEEEEGAGTMPARQSNPWMSSKASKQRPDEAQLDCDQLQSPQTENEGSVQPTQLVLAEPQAKRPMAGTESGTDSESSSESEVEDIDTVSHEKNIDEIFQAIEKPKKKAEKRKSLKNSFADDNKRKSRKRGNAKPAESGSNDETSSGNESEDSSDEEVDNTELVSKDGKEQESMALSLERRQTLDALEDSWSEDSEEDEDISTGDVVPMASASQQSKNQKGALEKKKPEEAKIDPKQFLTVDQMITSGGVQGETEGDGVASEQGALTAEEQQRLTIAQAFAADYVVSEFVSEKADAQERDKPKDVDLTLPGWGDWGGAGIKTSGRKRKRFTIKAPPAAPRRDRNLSGVIISETKDTAVAKHQVSSVPFPFRAVHQFEASIRQPVGKTWNPETAHKKLCKPKVVTRLGTAIEPMDKSEMFSKQKAKGDQGVFSDDKINKPRTKDKTGSKKVTKKRKTKK